MSAISEWSALDSESRPTSSKPVAASPRSTISPMPVMERSRTGRVIMPGLAEPAAAGAAAEDLDRHALVDGLGERHEGLLGVGPGVEVHDGVLGHAPRDPVRGRDDALDPAVGQVVDRRRTPGRRRRRCGPAASAAPRDRRVALRPSTSRMRSVTSSTACSPSPMIAASMKSAIGSGLNAACPPAMTIGSSRSRSRGVQRDAGQVERGEHVGVAELGGEARARTRRSRRTLRWPSTVNCGTPCSRSSASMSDHTAYDRSASASGRSLRTS